MAAWTTRSYQGLLQVSLDIELVSLLLECFCLLKPLHHNCNHQNSDSLHQEGCVQIRRSLQAPGFKPWAPHLFISELCKAS